MPKRKTARDRAITNPTSTPAAGPPTAQGRAAALYGARLRRRVRTPRTPRTPDAPVHPLRTPDEDADARAALVWMTHFRKKRAHARALLAWMERFDRTCARLDYFDTDEAIFILSAARKFLGRIGR